ncbi:MAG TPA: glutamyl-tRNA reductase [Opitutaceae bacterium]|nr:glutamyl-tRNA reductase [Opitutaceae bacterium]
MSAPGFFVLGATHHTAPLALREKLALSPAAEAALAAELADAAGLRELASLATCNRVEFYGVAADAAAIARVQAAFCAGRGFDSAEFERVRLSLTGPAAAQHLFEVAAGLDSQMLGENEIFGQVKDAYAAAQARGATGPVLNRVFQKAFQAAKHVRTHTAITAGQVSVANVAVDLALNIFGQLDQTRILVVGAGEIGEKTVRAFQSRGARSLAVSSRSGERAMELATALSASALPFEQREARLAEFDVVVCSTAAPETVISRASAEAAMRVRPSRPLFFIDLAMPRDVEAGVADLTNVFRYDLDDLAKIAEQNRIARAAEVERGRELLRARVAALWPRIEALLADGAAGAAAAAFRQHPA